MPRRKPKQQIVNVAEAKARLPELLRRAASGEDVIIARDNVPLVQLVPLTRPGKRKPGSGKGLIKMLPGFDDPLPDFDDYQ